MHSQEMTTSNKWSSQLQPPTPLIAGGVRLPTGMNTSADHILAVKGWPGIHDTVISLIIVIRDASEENENAGTGAVNLRGQRKCKLLLISTRQWRAAASSPSDSFKSRDSHEGIWIW